MSGIAGAQRAAHVATLQTAKKIKLCVGQVESFAFEVILDDKCEKGSGEAEAQSLHSQHRARHSQCCKIGESGSGSSDFLDPMSEVTPQKGSESYAIGVSHSRRDLFYALIRRLQQVHCALDP